MTGILIPVPALILAAVGLLMAITARMREAAAEARVQELEQRDARRVIGEKLRVYSNIRTEGGQMGAAELDGFVDALRQGGGAANLAQWIAERHNAIDPNRADDTTDEAALKGARYLLNFELSDRISHWVTTGETLTGRAADASEPDQRGRA
ncbi:MAG: hypothetical protein P0Y48_01395 [Candidatus Microbacterium phytovorans]|uniref:Uncharacterized protein n=1 Tax=Candidatus Microbacterium phytovorans TaxID=3121374 RepID=A0AAJ6B398_9MICO|nr:hypothetical protein [Microbacterium sp.]WEK13895.1 MAG: hypothetical protein P0Y48_01395 [Microbacterium sp.]